MDRHIRYALNHPDRQIVAGHFWQAGRMSIGLTVNIGME
jgi:hypothetical protein